MSSYPILNQCGVQMAPIRVHAPGRADVSNGFWDRPCSRVTRLQLHGHALDAASMGFHAYRSAGCSAWSVKMSLSAVAAMSLTTSEIASGGRQ